MTNLIALKTRWFYVLFSIIILWNLTPYITTNLSCADDAEIYAHTTDNGLNYDTEVYAKNTGRFFVYLLSPFSRIPYLMNIHIAKGINILFVLIGFFLLGYIIQLLIKDKWIALLGFLLLLTFLNVGPDLSPVISYPWSFTLPFDCILYSMILSNSYRLKQNRKYLYWSVTLFAIGLLFYEVFLIFLPLVFLISIGKESYLKNKTVKKKLSFLFKKSIPFALVGLIYLALFLGYRIFNPAVYDGTSLSNNLTLKTVIDTMIAYSRGAVPFYYINENTFYHKTSELLLNHQNNVLYFLQNAQLIWYVKALIISFLSFFILLNIKKQNLRMLVFILFVSVLFVFLPNLPIALTKKYTSNCWAHDAYIPTYFSFHFMMIAIAISISFIVFIKNKLIKNSVTTAVLIFVFTGSLCTDYLNYHILKNIRQTNYRFECVDKFAQSEVYKYLPENAQILSPNLYSITGRQNNTFDKSRPFKWHNYLKTKYGKSIKTYTNTDDFIEEYDTLKSNYYLKYSYNRKGFDQFIAFGELASNSKFSTIEKSILSDTITCFYYSSNKEFSLSFSVKPKQSDLSYFIANGKKIPLQGNHGKLKCRYRSYNDVFMPITIISKNIDMNTIVIDDLQDMEEVDVFL